MYFQSDIKPWRICKKRNLKQELNYELLLKKVYRVIKFNQKALLKPCIDMNTELRKKAKNDVEKEFFKLMNNEGFEESNTRRNYLVSDPNYYTPIRLKWKKTQILMSRLVCLGRLKLEVCQIVM